MVKRLVPIRDVFLFMRSTSCLILLSFSELQLKSYKLKYSDIFIKFALSKNYFDHCCKAQLTFVEIALLLNCHLYLVDSLSD